MTYNPNKLYEINNIKVKYIDIHLLWGFVKRFVASNNCMFYHSSMSHKVQILPVITALKFYTLFAFKHTSRHNHFRNIYLDIFSKITITSKSVLFSFLASHRRWHLEKFDYTKSFRDPFAARTVTVFKKPLPILRFARIDLTPLRLNIRMIENHLAHLLPNREWTAAKRS